MNGRVEEYVSADPSSYDRSAVDHAWYEETRLCLLRRLVSPHDRVLDVGCRDGEVILRLSQHIRGGLGLDIDRDSVAAASRRKTEAGAENVVFRVGDALSLDVETGACDVAMVLGDVLSYGNLYGKTDRVIGEMKRSLASGGRIIIDGTNWEWEYRQSPRWECFAGSGADRYVYHVVERTEDGRELDVARAVLEGSPLQSWIRQQMWPVSPQGFPASLDVKVRQGLPEEWLDAPSTQRAQYFTLDALESLLEAHGFPQIRSAAYGGSYDVVCRAGLQDALAGHMAELAQAEARLAWDMRSRTGPW
ncbi:MAG: methyltransferase domain-containing protein, partial [Candidatus Eisenbacteria bacterium]|nr:methyltransferase domain-containing protein [Candidatus Eisenbacteria bacterium]